MDSQKNGLYITNPIDKEVLYIEKNLFLALLDCEEILDMLYDKYFVLIK